jgi:DNA helicase-2/ATP-dependent DNA helicase PcrA
MQDDTTYDAEEAQYLTRTLRALDAELDRVSAQIEGTSDTLEEQKQFLWEHRRDMDGSEKAALRSVLDVAVGQGEEAVGAQRRLQRLRESPYFGRVDFAEDGADGRSFYIGVHGFREADSRDLLVHDWRAPVATLYYELESGPAGFLAPEGQLTGEITTKRQYKITAGRMEYMFESSVNIGDDVLRRELSQSTDDRMRNIVATIQREQNAIIRNETADVLILQGVAGSGKTSIALHRVAFLLYRFKETLSSEDVLILSPNRIFGDYIANVLPELGEEQIGQIDIDGIAERYLEGVTKFQTFSEQVVDLLEKPNQESAAARIRAKASVDFVEALDRWIDTRADEEFAPSPLSQRGEHLTAHWVATTFAALRHLPVFTRLDRLTDAAVALMKQEAARRHVKWTAPDTTSIRRQIAAMFPHTDAYALYRAFYQPEERRDLFHRIGSRTIEFSDVFPLVYTILRTSRQEGFGRIRHLLVDEMQDYTPIQYAVLRELFDCRMTILGDANQSVNPFSSSSMEAIRAVFPEADCLELRRSYRSTTEITDFAQRIIYNAQLIPVERHGPRPRIFSAPDRESEIAQIRELIRQHAQSSRRSLGIITRTSTQAWQLHQELSEAGVDVALLDYGSEAFSAGIVVTSAHVSKGLEFDHVIVAHAGKEYRTEMDRGMLYIACTRAMHQLDLTHSGDGSDLLAFAQAEPMITPTP